MKAYYYVFNRNGGIPKAKHENVSIAENEATRLAHKHPGEQFEVCKVVAMVTVPKSTTFWMDGEGPGEADDCVS